MSTRIKILFFHRTLRQSGAARQIFMLYQSLDRSLFDPVFVVQVKKHIFYKDPGGQKLLVLGESELNIPGSINELVRIIRREKPDIVQSFNTDGNLLAYLALRRAPVPCFFASLRNTNKSMLEMLAERRIHHTYTRLIVNSNAIKNEILGHCLIEDQKIQVIHNGIDTNMFIPTTPSARQSLRQHHNIPGNVFVIISVGRIAIQKNHECTIKALALVRDRIGPNIPVLWFCLGLAENKGYFQRLRKLVKSLGLDRICRFIESTAEIPDYYNLADVSVLSSDWEGMPNAVLESMACERLPVVAQSADNDGIVQHGINGLLFQSNDEKALADTLVSVITMDKNTKTAIEQRARADILEHYNIDAMVNNYQKLYQYYMPGPETLPTHTVLPAVI